MKIVVSKIIWGVIALLSIGGLVWIWLIGLPIEEYVATNDEAPSKVYTVRIAPHTYFDVEMSENEVLTKANMEDLFNFIDASVTVSTTPVKADLINADKQIYGRPGSFCYRVFDEAIVTVNSRTSTYQGYQSLLNNEPYNVYGEAHKLEKIEGTPFDLPELYFHQHIADKVYVSPNYKGYDWDEDKKKLMWFSPKQGQFYKVKTSYGLNSEAIDEALSTARACYGIEPKVAFTGKDYFMLFSRGYLIGVRKINANTNMTVVTNCPDQYEPALATLLGKEW